MTYLREQVYTPLLHVHEDAKQVAQSAILTYYASEGAPGRSHFAQLERDIVRLQSDLEWLRLAVDAIRSRGEDPLDRVPYPFEGEVPF